jgi:AcrR family transcriptional regulator
VTDEPSLRERRRRETSKAVAEAALDLALDQGWAAVTVDAIAARAGISRRTFFNYFATKDEALFHDAATWREEVMAEFQASSTPLLEALETLFVTQAERELHDRDRAMRVLELVKGSPELLPLLLARIGAQEDGLVAAITARDGVDEFTARTAAALAGSLARVSGASWLSGLQPDPVTATRAAWATLRTLTTEPRSDS